MLPIWEVINHRQNQEEDAHFVHVIEDLGYMERVSHSEICTATVMDGKTYFGSLDYEEFMKFDLTVKPSRTCRDGLIIYRFQTTEGNLSDEFILDPQAKKCSRQEGAKITYYSSDKWQSWFPADGSSGSSDYIYPKDELVALYTGSVPSG